MLRGYGMVLITCPLQSVVWKSIHLSEIPFWMFCCSLNTMLGTYLFCAAHMTIYFKQSIRVWKIHELFYVIKSK